MDAAQPVTNESLSNLASSQPASPGQVESSETEVRLSESEPPAVAPGSTLAIVERQIAPTPGNAPIAHPDAGLWKGLTEERRNKAALSDGLGVAFSSDGKTVASSSNYSNLRLFDVGAASPSTPGLATSGAGLAEPEALRQANGRADEGAGPGWGGDRYDPLTDNPFREVSNAPVSTFSIDVDTASYSKTRMHLMEQRTLPPPGAVRIEELINYFDYAYKGPQDGQPFAAHVEAATCPWQPEHRLVRVGIKGKEIDRSERPTSNLVFLLDVSGSMNQPNKLPLVKRGMQRLAEELGENDKVAIVVYAGAAGLVLPSTGGDQKKTILDALEQLHAGGSTNGGQGIQLAYQVALDNFVKGGTNRVILCTDGDFNVGTTSTDDLAGIVENNAKDGVFLSVLGFGMGNHNDAMLENISNKGNGNYAFIDTDAEAQKVLVEQLSGTLVTIAKDVKIQVEFNPAQVASYRLIGYANRLLAAEDFNDDKKDAGEIGAGHTVTALYEIVAAGAATKVEVPPVDGLKYQHPSTPTEAAASGELLMLKLRYKDPDADTSKPLSFPVKDKDRSFGQATEDFQFAAAVASFGMLLRDSQYKGTSNYDAVLEMATSATGVDKNGYRAEFLGLVTRAKELTSP
jgi:Ca-activated chloride channel family protein